MIDKSERRIVLVRLLQHSLLPPEAGRMKEGRVSPLIDGEADLLPTAAVLASRHPTFNGQGLGTDLPGTGEWPTIILIGAIGAYGRLSGTDAIAAFFGIKDDLADRLINEEPSDELIQVVSSLDNKVAPPSDVSYVRQ